MRAVNFSPALTVTRAPLRDACAPLVQAICALLEGAKPAQLQTLIESQMIIRAFTAPLLQIEPLLDRRPA